MHKDHAPTPTLPAGGEGVAIPPPFTGGLGGGRHSVRLPANSQERGALDKPLQRALLTLQAKNASQQRYPTVVMLPMACDDAAPVALPDPRPAPSCWQAPV